MKFALLAGLGVAGLCGFLLFYTTSDAHVELVGEIQKVRTGALEELSSVAIVDFRVTNPSKHTFVARSVELALVLPDGRIVVGQSIAEVDAVRLLKALPLLGPKYNETLKLRDKVPAKTQVDRMLSATFKMTEAEIQRRARFVVRVLEVDGNLSEIAEKR
jgi:hypothetical protein